jgi:hypothetical protein
MYYFRRQAYRQGVQVLAIVLMRETSWLLDDSTQARLHCTGYDVFIT